MIVRLYENSLYGFITVDDVISSLELKVENSIYQLAGVTMYRSGHYCAIVFVDGDPYWYDGILGHLDTLSTESVQTRFPVHAIYCKIR